MRVLPFASFKCARRFLPHHLVKGRVKFQQVKRHFSLPSFLFCFQMCRQLGRRRSRRRNMINLIKYLYSIFLAPIVCTSKNKNKNKVRKKGPFTPKFYTRPLTKRWGRKRWAHLNDADGRTRIHDNTCHDERDERRVHERGFVLSLVLSIKKTQTQDHYTLVPVL